LGRDQVEQGIGSALGRAAQIGGGIAFFNDAAAAGFDIGIDQCNKAFPGDAGQTAGERD